MQVLQFLSVVFTALALVPGGAHLFELPNKIGLSKEDYFAAQSIYRGWALFGIVIFAAIAANFLVALEQWHRSKPYWLTLVTGLVLTATLIVFSEWTYPANQATANWTAATADWERLRHFLPWAPAFAGVAGLVWAMARHCLMNRVNDSLH